MVPDNESSQNQETQHQQLISIAHFHAKTQVCFIDTITPCYLFPSLLFVLSNVLIFFIMRENLCIYFFNLCMNSSIYICLTLLTANTYFEHEKKM